MLDYGDFSLIQLEEILGAFDTSHISSSATMSSVTTTTTSRLTQDLLDDLDGRTSGKEGGESNVNVEQRKSSTGMAERPIPFRKYRAMTERSNLLHKSST